MKVHDKQKYKKTWPRDTVIVKFCDRFIELKISVSNKQKLNNIHFVSLEYNNWET